MGSVRLLMLAVIMLASAAGSAPAIAQEIKPLDIAKDENGVDLLSGRIQRRSPVVSVPGSARLKFTSLQDLQPYLRGRIYASPDNRTTYEINDGSGTSEFFDCTDNGCPISMKGTGSTLIADNYGKTFDYYQGGTGTNITFNLQNNQQTQIMGNMMFYFYPTSIHYPDEGHNFYYDTYDDPGIGKIRRISQVTSTRGYKLVLTYQAPMGQTGYSSLAQVTMYAPDYTTIVAQNTYNSDGSVTDLAGRVYSCCSDSTGRSTAATDTSLRLPGETVDTLVATRGTCNSSTTSLAMAVTTDGAAYNYTFTPQTTSAGSCKVMDHATVTGPLGFARTYNINVNSSGRPYITSVVDSLNKTTSYTYNGALQLTKVTYPEGNSAGVTYDGMGNITESRLKAKAGTGLADIVETASYPRASNCAMGTFCITPDVFKPDWTKDAKGQQTDYTWSTNGLLLTKLEPADASGMRRKTINTYTASRLLKERICAANAAGVEQTCGTTARSSATSPTGPTRTCR